MREILFRGKRMDNGEWVEGAFCPKNSEGDIPCIIVYNGTLAGWWLEVDPATVGQFTGLLDKNGKRIFEGDVVEYNDGYDYIDGEVVFEFGAFGIGSCDVIDISTACCDNFANLWQLYWDQEAMDAPELYYCKVIGNIQDNPELLEVTPDE